MSMKFNELSEEDIEYISEIYYNKEISWDKRLNTLAQRFKRSERTIQHWIAKLGWSTKHAEESPQFLSAKARKFNKTKKIHQEKSSNLCLYKILHFHKLTIREVFLDTKMHIAKQF